MMTNKILKTILLVLVVIFLITLFIFISTYKDKQAEMTETTATTQTQEFASEQAEGFFLTVSSPVDGATQSSKVLVVKGKTTVGTEIFVNDKEGKADAGGNFSVNLTLDEGENIVLVIASDASGNYLEKELTVTVASFQ